MSALFVPESQETSPAVEGHTAECRSLEVAEVI